MASGEFDFIDWITGLQKGNARVVKGVGDDMAVLKWRAEDLMLVAIDQVLDGVHFDSAAHSPRAIGKKVMNRNLSDCAAMACLPVAAVVSVALPRGCGLEYAKELYLGLKEAAEPFDCEIVGGDTGSWGGKLAMSVAILGRSDGVEPVLRTGAQPGDGVYVTGALGGSILGRHMSFLPRIGEGRLLGKSGVVRAMIDISDGLSRDLRQICRASGVGAVIEADAVPIHADAVELAGRDGRLAIEHALHDGEDHELLFTASSSPPMGVRIGMITAELDILIRNKGGLEKLEVGGWEHQC